VKDTPSNFKTAHQLPPRGAITRMQMFDPISVLVALFAVVIFFLFRRGIKSKDAGKRYPPSIPALPLLGSVPFYTGGLEGLHTFFMRKAEQLGPVISFKSAGRFAVSLNGKEAIVDALQKHAETFGDRPDFWTEANILNRDFKGINFTHWTESAKYYRKLTLTVLKDFGFGINQEMDIRISQEVEEFITHIRKLNGCPFNPRPALKYGTANVVLSILFGSESQAGIERSKLIDDAFDFIDNVDSRIDYAPIIRFLPSFRKKIQKLTGAHERLMAQIDKAIEQNKRNPSERNFVTRFIEIEGPNYSHIDLMYVLRDLSFAGADTVGITLLWALLELANHPKVLSRLQSEIDEVCSGDRAPSIDDKPRLPYTEAVMCEVMRRHTLVIYPVGRQALKDTEVCGYFIPRGCLTITNIYGAHMDPKVWGDPENFRPERFLDKDNNVIRRNDIIPFNLGKRSCIGEILARQEFYLFLANIVKHFDVQPPEGQNSVSATEVYGLVVKPSPFKIRMIPRC
jgi:cytochrome P450